MSGSAENNFGLSREQFAALRAELAAGRDELFQRIFLHQFSATQRYLVQQDGASPDDAYDATMEALLHLRAGLVRGSINYGNLRFLYTRMARQQLYRAAKRPLETIPEDLPEPVETSDPTIDRESYQLLSSSWKKLGDACRQLLLDLFYRSTTVEEISRRTSTLPATIRKRKQRCLEKLRTAVFASPLRAER